MLVRGVVDDELGDHPQAAAVGLLHEGAEVLARAVLRVDVVIVGDVIPVVAPGRRIERQQPDRVDAEVLDVLQLAGEALEVAAAVIVAVEEGADV